jgi:hypothetical protein
MPHFDAAQIAYRQELLSTQIYAALTSIVGFGQNIASRQPR